MLLLLGHTIGQSCCSDLVSSLRNPALFARGWHVSEKQFDHYSVHHVSGVPEGINSVLNGRQSELLRRVRLPPRHLQTMATPPKPKGQPLGTLFLTLAGLVLVVSIANPKMLVRRSVTHLPTAK